MWLGKISIIMYVFSIAILFSSYYMNQIFHDSYLSNNSSITFTALNTLLGSYGSTVHTYTLNPALNTALIFGDFIAALTVIGGIMTGSVFNDSWQIISNSGLADISVGLLMGLLFDLATVLLVVYIFANRSL